MILSSYRVYNVKVRFLIFFLLRNKVYFPAFGWTRGYYYIIALQLSSIKIFWLCYIYIFSKCIWCIAKVDRIIWSYLTLALWGVSECIKTRCYFLWELTQATWCNSQHTINYNIAFPLESLPLSKRNANTTVIADFIDNMFLYNINQHYLVNHFWNL